MTSITLTPCIKAIIVDGQGQGAFNNPILQLIEEPKILNGAQQKQNLVRYKVTISDGVNMTSALLFHNVVDTSYSVEDLKSNQVIRVTRFTATKNQGRILIIIHNLESLGTADRIGTPTKIIYHANANATAAAAAPPPPAAAPARPLPPKVVQSPIKVGGNNNNNNRPPMQQNNSNQRSQLTNAGTATTAIDPQDLSKLPIFPIKSLSSYNSRWCIKARVTVKSDIKTFNSKKAGGSTGSLFSCELIDEAGTEIRATAFNEVCDKLYPLLVAGNVYLISKGSIRTANKRFTSIKHDYEIVFSAATIVQPCTDDADAEARIPRNHYDFVPIDQLRDTPKDQTVDVIGIATQVSEPQTVTSKATGTQFAKRTVTLLDTSSYSIEVTFWGDKAVTEIDPNVVVAIRGCRVSDFNGKSLGTTHSSLVEFAPDIPEASNLRNWFDSQNGNITVYPLSNGGAGGGGDMGGGAGGAHSATFYTIGAAREAQLGLSDEADYFSVNALISIIKHDKYSYLACLDCKGKVEPGYDGKYTCAKCHKTHDTCSERYVFSFAINDFTSSMWLSAFDEAGKVIMGKEASEITALKSAGDGDRLFDEAFMDVSYRWFSFSVRGRLESYLEEKRPKYSVQSVKRLNFAEESKHLIQIINSYN